MRILSWRLIVALVVGVTLVSLASSWYEVRSQKDALRAELERQAGTLGDNLAGRAELYLQLGDRARLEQMVRQFSDREHLLGIGVYEPDGTPLVVTTALNALLPGSPELLTDALKTNRDESRYMRVRFKRIYVVAMPLHASGNDVLGGIVMAHDTGIHSRGDLSRLEQSLRSDSASGTGDCGYHHPYRALESHRTDRARRRLDESPANRPACSSAVG